MSGRQNALFGAEPIPGTQPQNPLLQQPTQADAWSFNAPVLADAARAAQTPEFWQGAAQQYGNALLLGTTAPGEASLIAAIRHNGKVYRAPDDYPTHLGALLRGVPDEQRATAWSNTNNRGFVTDRGRYLDRFKAADYAQDNGLIARDAPPYAHTHNEMITEWLQSYRDWMKQQ